MTPSKRLDRQARRGMTDPSALNALEIPVEAMLQLHWSPPSGTVTTNSFDDGHLRPRSVATPEEK